MLFGGTASAATPASGDVCHPETDLWGCECPEEIEEGVTCHEVAYSELPEFDDLSLVDTEGWIHTEYDSERELYHVTVDLDSMPGKGIFKTLERNGHWDSESELLQYWSTLLGVPIDEESGRLENFEYTQVGTSRKYQLLSGFLASSGTFWKDLVTDGSANRLYIDGVEVGVLGQRCLPAMYEDICDSDGNGAPCRSEVPLMDGRMSALSANEVDTWISNATGFGCARNFLGELRWDMSLYVVENANLEQAENTEPFHCEINEWPDDVQCNLSATEELTVSSPIVDPNDPTEVSLKRRFRIVRARGDLLTEGEYFRNDSKINDNRVRVDESFSIEVEYGREFLNGMCTVSAVSMGTNMDMVNNGTAHRSVSPPHCLP